MKRHGLKRSIRKRQNAAIRKERRAKDPTFWHYTGDPGEALPEPRSTRATVMPDAETSGDRRRALEREGVVTLRKMAAKAGIPGAWKKRKPDLVDALLDAPTDALV